MRTKKTPFSSTRPIVHIDLEEFSKETLRRIDQNNLTELGICNKDNALSRDGRLFTSRDGDDYCRLGSCIGRNNNLKSLYVQLEGIGLSAKDSGFFDGIKQNSSINKFRLSGYADKENNSIGEVGCALLEAFQTNNSHLTSLTIWSCNIGSVHERVILNTMLSDCKNLNEFSFNHNSMTDEQLLLMVEAMRGHPSLKKICLSYNRIGNAGCEALGTLLRDPNCKFDELNLTDNNIHDEGVLAIVNGLSRNKHLQRLNLKRNNRIGRSMLDVFSRLLCNTPNINDIHSSNHTLLKLDMLPSGNGTHLHLLLFLNRGTNKNHVAIKKILQCHPNIGMEPLFEWGSRDERNLMSLPYVIDWFDRAEEAVETITFEREKTEGYNTEERKLSAIYQFALAMPMMFIPSSHTKVEDKKRKRVAI